MEVLLNDESINGQFTEESFFEYMATEVLPIMKILSENNIELLKTYDVYKRYVTNQKMMIDYIKVQGNPSVDLFKNYLVALSYNTPYWNDDIKTSPFKKYTSQIIDAPNCISEAYERKGIILSFKEGGFDDLLLEIKVDEKCKKVKNVCTYGGMRDALCENGLIDVWSNSFVINKLGYKFEIRFNEGHHNLAHFHLSNARVSASISIPDADILEGGLERSNANKAISWSMQNMKKIVELWNNIHPEKRVEY